MKKIIKLLLSFLIVTTLFAGLPVKEALAQNEWWNPEYKDWVQKVEGAPATEIFGERYTYAQVKWILYSVRHILDAQFVNAGVTDANEPSIGIIINNPGPILSLANLIDVVHNDRPASGIDYVAERIEKLNIVSEANAQTESGYGFAKALLPIRQLWVVARNAAYSLMTLVVIVLAFMIMFRTKISAQAVVTAQSAIPRVAIAFLAITFSYAIAGFLIDLAFVSQGLIAALVSSNISNKGPIDIFNQMNNGVGSMLAFGIVFILQPFLSGGGILGQVTNLGIADVVANAVLSPIDFVIGLIVMILIFIAMLRIFWLLILTYARLIFLVIGAPFIFLFSAVGSGGGIGGWIKGIVSQLAVFVAIGVLIMFAHIFFWGFGNGVTVQLFSFGGQQVLAGTLNIFGIESVVGSEPGGLFPSGFSFGDNHQAIGFFVSLAVILSIPKLANAVRDAVSTGRATYGFEIGGKGAIKLGADTALGSYEEGLKRSGATAPWWFVAAKAARGFAK